MTAKYLIVVCALLCLAPLSAKSSEAKVGNDDIYALSKDFAECSALYDAFRDLLKEANDVDTAEVYNGLSNGAELVAETIARVYGNIKNEKMFVAGIYDTRLPLFKSLLKNSGAKDKSIVLQMESCKILNPLQAQMVDEIKKKAYGADTSSNQYFK